MEKTKGRVQTILDMNSKIFKVYLEDLTQDDVQLFKDYQEVYKPTSNLSESSTIIKNTTENVLSNLKYDDVSDFQLKLIELALTFPFKDFFDSLAYGYDALSDEHVAMEYNTTVENVKMMKAFDKKAFELDNSRKRVIR